MHEKLHFGRLLTIYIVLFYDYGGIQLLTIQKVSVIVLYVDCNLKNYQFVKHVIKSMINYKC